MAFELALEEQSPNEEEMQLIADLAGEYSDKWHAGEEASIEEYLNRLSSDKLRQEFIEVVDMDRFLTAVETLKVGP